LFIFLLLNLLLPHSYSYPPCTSVLFRGDVYFRGCGAGRLFLSVSLPVVDGGVSLLTHARILPCIYFLVNPPKSALTMNLHVMSTVSESNM
jgi:hypothetical protein